MPRLTNIIYLERRRFLRSARQDFRPIFSVVPATQQLELHRYYQTKVEVSDEDLIAKRRELTESYPSLPHQASKTFHTVYYSFRQAFE